MKKKTAITTHVKYMRLGKSDFAIRVYSGKTIQDDRHEVFRMNRGSWTLLGETETEDHACYLIVEHLRLKHPVIQVKKLAGESK